jgi:hypothetical protein
MYSVDHKDTVVELDNVPQSSIGAPCPMILVGEDHLHVAYYLENTPPGWDGTTVKVLSEHTGGEPVALVSFTHPYAHMFGPPNDEAFEGHPLKSRGLRPYAVFEVVHSSWIRQLERMNSVHEHHQPERFAEYHHFVFAFHDTTFECVAENFSVSVHTGNVAQVLQLAFRDDNAGEGTA